MVHVRTEAQYEEAKERLLTAIRIEAEDGTAPKPMVFEKITLEDLS
jgi:hypothetical protein